MNAFAIADRYWASHFGVAEEAFLAEPKCIVTHTGELAAYEGVLALSRAGAFIFSLPPDRMEVLGPVLRGFPANPEWPAVVAALRPFSRLILGPAYLGYADTVPSLTASARAVSHNDISAVATLQNACGPEEWEHGRCDVTEQPASGVFIEGTLAALAGYEIWGGTIAHICVVTHPAFRGCGHATAAVAHLAARALQAGLLPQYRTLLSNSPSMQVAQKLGFAQYGSTIAARI